MKKIPQSFSALEDRLEKLERKVVCVSEFMDIIGKLESDILCISDALQEGADY